MTTDNQRPEVPRPAPGGATRFGPYRLCNRIAVGGTAEVYLAEPADGRAEPRRLVVKRLLPHMLTDNEGRTMFEREARLHAAVQHENVVTVFGSGLTEDGEPYLAMEYVDGVDTFRLLRRLTQEGRTLPAGVAVYVAREVLRALGSVHSSADASGTPLGIIHRDVTPSNIYLAKDGSVKLGDFGIARSTTRATVRSAEATMLKGKFAYLAPEQVAGEPFDHRADLFSLACVLVEMLIGKPLFSGSGQLSVLLAIRDCRLDPIVESKQQLPKGMFDLLQVALAREPQRRYQSASAFAAALLPFQMAPGQAKAELSALVGWAQATTSSSAMQAVRESARALRAATPLPRTLSLKKPTPSLRDGPLRPTADVYLDVDPDPETPQRPRPAAAPDATDRSSPVPTPRAEALAFDLEEAVRDSERATGEYSRLPSFVLTARGVRHGPWTYARLVEALATGAVGRGDKVDFMGSGLRPVEELSEIARFLPAKTSTTGEVQAGLGSPDFKDELSAQSLLEMFVRILAYKETGVLFIERPETGGSEPGRKELYFVDGRLHHVSSSNASELLGQYLVRRGMLTRDELDFALAVLPRYQGRIGDTLISLGLVSAVDMFRAIREQGRDRVTDLFLWSSGKVSFFRGQTAPHVEFPLDQDVPSLLLSGLEAAQPDETPVARFRAQLDDTLEPVPPEEHPAPTAQFPPLVARVKGLVGRPMKLRELLAAAVREKGDLTAGDVLRGVQVLLAARVVRFA